MVMWTCIGGWQVYWLRVLLRVIHTFNMGVIAKPRPMAMAKPPVRLLRLASVISISSAESIHSSCAESIHSSCVESIHSSRVESTLSSCPYTLIDTEEELADLDNDGEGQVWHYDHATHFWRHCNSNGPINIYNLIYIYIVFLTISYLYSFLI